MHFRYPPLVPGQLLVPCSFIGAKSAYLGFILFSTFSGNMIKSLTMEAFFRGNVVQYFMSRQAKIDAPFIIVHNAVPYLLRAFYMTTFLKALSLLRAKRSGGAAGASAERSKLFPMLWGLKIAR